MHITLAGVLEAGFWWPWFLCLRGSLSHFKLYLSCIKFTLCFYPDKLSPSPQYLSTGWVFPWYHWTRPHPVPFLWMGILLISLNQPPHPCPISFNWVGIPLTSFNQASPQYLSTGWVFLSIFQMSPIQFLSTGWVFPSVCQAPIREIWEPGETCLNLSLLPKEADGPKGPLLASKVPKLQFLLEFR